MILEILNPLEIVMITLSVIFVLKKIVEIERQHVLRVTVLTTLFSLVLLFTYWIVFVNSFVDPWESYPEEDHFTLTEM